MDPLDMMASPFKLVHRYSPFASELPQGMKRELRFIFGDRVSFDPAERAVYAKDMGALPRDLVDMVMKRMPFAVVVPRDRGDLVECLRLAERHGLPVTPRGNGTSTNGASIPAEAGLAVDMRVFDRILAVDKQAMVVTCEPGVTFAQLAKALEPEGLAPLVEPETPWASTVGGSVALGRYGLGSAMHGSIADQCVEATLLAPDRALETVTGKDLELVRGLQGSTGFLLQVKLQVGVARALEPFLLSTESPEAAAGLFSALAATRPVHLQLLAPSYVSWIEAATGAKAFLQEKHFLLAVYAKDDNAREAVQARAEAAGAKMEDKAAPKAWELRHKAIAMHKLGPTRLLVEVVVPPQSLERALADLPAAVAGETALDAVALRGDKVLVRAHLLEDERRMEFPLSLGNVFAVLDAAHKLGGHAAYPSLLLAGDAKDAIGPDRFARLKAFKQKRDPWEVMNPGKVWPARMSGMPMATLPMFLATQKPILKALRMLAPSGGFEKIRASDVAVATAVGHAQAGSGLAGLSDALYACSHCGLCNTTTPEVGPWESLRPRGLVQVGKALLEGDGRWTERLRSNAFRQPLTRAGSAVCPSGIPIEEAGIALRAEVVQALGAPEAIAAMEEHVAKQGNPFGKPKAQRGAWMPAGFASAAGAKVLYYADSAAACERPQVAKAGLELVSAAGPAQCLGAAEPDSGAVLWMCGLHAAASKQAEAAMKAVVKTGAELLVTPDATTAHVMRTLWPKVAEEKGIAWTVQVRHTSEFLLPLVGKGLSLGASQLAGVAFSEPEAAPDAHTAKLLAKVPGLQAKALPILVTGAHGGTPQAHPGAAESAALQALDRAQAAGVAVVVSSDPLAEAHLAAVAAKAKRSIQVMDVLEVLAQASGQPGGTAQAPGAPASGAAEPATPPAAKPKLSPEELEARKKAALEKAAAAKAAKAAQPAQA